MMKKTILLRDFVYRTLIKRIAIATVAIAMLLIIAVSLLEEYNNKEVIQQLAVKGVNIFSQVIVDVMDNKDMPSLQSTLDQLTGSRVYHPDGHYVYFEVYDQQGQIMATVEDKKFEQTESVKSILIVVPRITDIKQLPIFKRGSVNKQPMVGVVLPVYDARGEVRAFVLGVYAVSEKVVDDFKRKLRRSLLLVVIIVLITSVLLYPVIVRLTKSLSDYSTDLLNANLDMLETLGSAIAKRDSDTSAHNYRVTILAVRLAEKLELNKDPIKGLIKGSFLHDVGKIGISDHILLKPGKLDDEEFTIMKTHVNHGIDIVKNSSWLRDAVDVVASHHEKYDGSGYPAGFSSENIPINARIFAIADVFDALTSRRPYKEPFSFDKTMAILRDGKGNHFDPDLLEAFENIAEPLYHHLSGREDEGLKAEVLSITQQYFSSGLDSLRY